jgi:glutamyl-tRNA reductase
MRESGLGYESLVLVGISYRTASLKVLGQSAISSDRLPQFLGQLTSLSRVNEAVVLATCNRVEIYADVDGGEADRILELWAAWSGLDVAQLGEFVYERHGSEAIAHLLAVTAGLDSMVVGERQIQLQVKKAFSVAHSVSTCGRMLDAAFRNALRVGRRVRAETAVSTEASSVLEVALDAAGRPLGGLEGRTVLILGAGQVGRIAVDAVGGKARRVLVANRMPEKAAALAARVGGECVSLSQRAPDLADVDLVIPSTGASSHMIRRLTRRGPRDGQSRQSPPKDLPTTPVPDLTVAAVPVREDPGDVLVARDGHTLASLPVRARVGTGSPRRAAQLRALGLPVVVVPIRGNVDTRLRMGSIRCPNRASETAILAGWRVRHLEGRTLNRWGRGP